MTLYYLKTTDFCLKVMRRQINIEISVLYIALTQYLQIGDLLDSLFLIEILKVAYIHYLKTWVQLFKKN